MRIQEDRSRQKNILIEVIAELPKENWKDTEKNYIRCCTTTLTSQKEWLMKGRTELKIERLRQGPRTIVAKLLNYKDKGHILKNTHHLKDTNIYIYKDFSKKLVIRKSLWDEVKKLRQQGKYAVIKYDKIYSI